MLISPNKVVSLLYQLEVDNGQGERALFEETPQDQPLVFLYGKGMLLEDFEKNIHNKKAGEAFNFSIVSERAYGDYNDDLVAFIPSQAFMVNGKVEEGLLEVGNVLPMNDPDGNQLQGEIVEVTPEGVVMDFNHPLAGFDLYFSGKIVSVREATSEEVQTGQIRSASGLIY